MLKKNGSNICLLLLLVYSTGSIAGDQRERLPKHVNSSITQDRAARDLARVAGGNGPAARKAYSEIREGEKGKSPDMTYALALFYLDVWNSTADHGFSPDHLFSGTVNQLNANTPGFKSYLSKHTIRPSAADRIYYKYIHYLKIAAGLGDPTAESDLGSEYFWEPLRMLMLVLFMNRAEAGGDALRTFITEQHMGKAWALMLNKSWRLEGKAEQQGSPSALYELAFGRMVLTDNRMMTRNDASIAYYAPYLRQSIHSYIVHSKIGTIKQSAEYGNVDAIQIVLCKTYSEGGDTKKWWNELRYESKNRHQAKELTTLVEKFGGVAAFCRKK
jgi:hypothetical protein